MGGIKGDNTPRVEDARYLKFGWNDTSYIPKLGELDYQPKGGATRVFTQGEFAGEHIIRFPAIKKREYLAKLGACAYCGRTHDDQGNALKLTSEHIIPEALGAGIEFPDASCSDCQRVTAEYESSVVEEMFDPVRRNLLLAGKQGVLKKKNFEVDIGVEITEKAFIPEAAHPTILCMPQFFPAPMYSTRPLNTNGMFNLMLYNLNFRREMLERYDIETFCTQSIDTARFCQMIAKIGHMACLSIYKIGSFKPLVGDFARTQLSPKTPSSSHFDCVGCLWSGDKQASEDLHEIEVGRIAWNGKSLLAARVRLFATYNMPSYHVAVGELG